MRAESRNITSQSPVPAIMNKSCNTLMLNNFEDKLMVINFIAEINFATKLDTENQIGYLFQI